MSRTPDNFGIVELSAAGDNTLSYVVPVATVTSGTLVITNLAAVKNIITVKINNGTSDFTLVAQTLPAGIGKTWRVFEFSDEKLKTGFTIKINLGTASPVNVFLSGNEVTSD